MCYQQNFSWNFIRTHKSHLVNNKFISFIDHNGFAVLKDNSRVEVSCRSNEEVMSSLKQECGNALPSALPASLSVSPAQISFSLPVVLVFIAFVGILKKQ